MIKKAFHLPPILLILFFIFSTTSLMAQTTVNADIVTKTTWDLAGSPYQITTFIEVSDTLIINPGVEIQYPSGGMIEVTGHLLANGTLNDSIRFHSTGTNPGGGVYFNSGSGEVSYAIFDTLKQNGYATSGAAIYCINSTVQISNTKITSNNGSNAKGIRVSSGAVTIDSCVISLCENGMEIISGSPTVSQILFVSNLYDIKSGFDGVQNIGQSQLNVVQLTSSGTLTNNARLPQIDSTGTTYILPGSLRVDADTLFLAPGILLKLSGSIEVRYSGVIWAVGTPQDTIRFRSNSGNNGGIKASTGKVFLEYIRMDGFSQSSNENAAIWVENTGNLFLKNSFIRGLRQYSNNRGLLINGGTAQIEQTRIDSCRDGIFIWDGSPTLQNCVFTRNQNSDILAHPSGLSNVSTCQLEVVELSKYFGQVNNVGGIPETKGNAIFPRIDSTGFRIRMPSGLRVVDTLVIEPGVSIDFPFADAIKVFGNGRLEAVGTPEDSIYFFSSNNSLAYYGSGIWVTNGSIELEYCRFNKVGNASGTNSSGGAIFFESNNASGEVKHCLFENGKNHGIRVDGANPRVFQSTIKSCKTGLWVDTGNPVLSSISFIENERGIYSGLGGFEVVNSNIIDNTLWGIENQGFADIYAIGCWWGHATGPYHALTNPLGLGNKVSDKVIFTPIFQGPVQENGLSLIDFSPDKGGNNGDVVINIYGTGLHQNIHVSLTKSGEPAIAIPDTNIFFISPNNIAIVVDLRNKPIGLWNLNVLDTTVHDSTIIIANGFEIVTGEEPVIDVEVIGNTGIRPNRWSQFFLTVKNEGLVEAHGVPFWLALPPNIEVEFHFDLLPTFSPNGLDPDSIPLYILIDTLWGEAKDLHVYGFLIPSIPANGQSFIRFSLKTSSITGFDIIAWGGKPIKGSPVRTDKVACIFDALELATSPFPGIGCIFAVMNTTTKILDDIVTGRKRTFSLSSVEEATQSYSWLAAETIFSCVPGVNSANGVINTIGSAIGTFFGWESTAMAGMGTVVNCCKWLCPDATPDTQPVTVAFSADPNEKVGISGAGAQQFIKKDQSINYTVFFENLETATAPAQEVLILDTLPTGIFDFSTFEFGPIGFGDTLMVPITFEDSFQTYVDLRPQENLLLKITGNFDKSAGIIRWKFTSLDPVNMTLTSNPLIGFLPPNINPSEGEGNVSFSIQLDSTIAHGTPFSNRANIIFDNNLPIITDYWSNVVDAYLPLSRVDTLQIITFDTIFTVSWKGSDLGAGVLDYSIYYKKDGGNYGLWLYRITDTMALFKGETGSTYYFYAIARDSVGNIESKSPLIEAQTTIDILLPFGPTDLSGFVREDNMVLLNWQVPDLPKFQQFEVQRSLNGQSFNPIIWVPGVEGQNVYQSIDTNPNFGQNYYRLKLINPDGSSFYSNVIEVFVNQPMINIYPNPTEGRITLSIQGETENATWEILDIYGKHVLSGVIRAPSQNIDLSNFSSGMYLFRAFIDGKAVEKKIFKLSE